ncbi:ABC transporter ATP-binding protein [Halothermothrix orenii]|nr:ABC transporter ATP-binding protein [Halothermothrix orenii]
MFQMGIVLVGGVYFAATGRISLGTLVVFITYEGFLLWPIRQMGRILSDMGKTQVSLGRIGEILKEDLEENDGKLKPEIKGNIEFEDVYFSYDDNKPVLNGISFRIKAGETVAILGPTGSGKSTLVQLLARLYDYSKGSIRIDGIEITDIDKKWLRRQVGLILQEPFLFARSIKENIKLANMEADDSKVYEAANMAAIHDVITSFDQGYDTLVGERGVSLSGGQKQRVAIARTLIRDCPILIFDDSLSAVDTETDAAIQKELRERKDNATTIIISHRITTLARADRILVLDKGRIVQSGSHEELIRQPGLYRRIWNIQSSLERDLEYM